jgi:eight-cysteine-cluster-containing protein
MSPKILNKNPLGKTRRVKADIKKPHQKTKLAYWNKDQPSSNIMDIDRLQFHKEKSVVKPSSLKLPSFLILFVAMTASCACGGSKDSVSPRVDATAAQTTSEVSKTESFTGEGCARTGCSGQICAAAGESVITTCQWREEYACYKAARCEKQSNGQCGWTTSATLDACIKTANAR